MMHFFFPCTYRPGTRALTIAAMLGLAGLLAYPAVAQSGPKPTWAVAALGTGTAGTVLNRTLSTAIDASGNVVVVGSFEGTLTFGSTTLTSTGSTDLFVAKYLTASGTWAWAMRGGGAGTDAATAVAVRGSSIYLTGTIVNSNANVSSVTFGGAGVGAGVQYGTSGSNSPDIFLAKYIDQGSSTVLGWTQVAGGASDDNGAGLAVDATGSRVYVTGNIVNNQADIYAVRFGGSGTVAGTAPQAGAVVSTTNNADLVLASYTDNGATATFNWSQVAGGSSFDQGRGLAVRGSRVYVAGVLSNTRTNAAGVLVGGAGTVAGTLPQYGASATLGQDVLLAAYDDAGTSATVAWTQIGGGTGLDDAYGVAVSGNNVYVVGDIFNNQVDFNSVRFGGSNTAAGTVVQAGATGTPGQDWLLAKYTDNGSSATLGWTQVAGGIGYEEARSVATSSNRVYVAGYFVNNAANANGVLLGGSGTVAGTATQVGATPTISQDVVAAGYLDNGSSATLVWTQAGGGTSQDLGLGLAVDGTRLYLGGSTTPPATFGALTIGSPNGATSPFLGALNLTATLAATAALVAVPLTLAPNPASGPVILSGAAAAMAGQVVDAVGREVATFRTDATGKTALPAGLAPGLYLVRVGSATGRWIVE